MIIKEDVMKQIFSISTALVLFSIFIVGTEAFGAKSLYDDFSGTYIDSQKWEHREFVREVVGGKLVSKIGNASGNGNLNSLRTMAKSDAQLACFFKVWP